MRTKIKQLAYLCGGLFLSFALAGFVAAQTTGGTGGTVMMCPDGSSIPMGGTCPTTSGNNTGGTGTTSSMTNCPNGTQVPVGTACPSTMTTCPNGTQVPVGSTCPSTMTTCPDGTQVPSGTTCSTQENKCTSANGKWCKNSDGATGWCSYSSTPCPAYDEPSCTAQSGEWCKYTSGTGGYCATNGAKCPINDEPTCVAKGRPWCKSAGAGSVSTAASGWCGEVGYKCPANDEPSCKAQGSQWCTSTAATGGAGSTGWCQTSGECPINDSGACSVKGRIWCPYTSGSGGWCATSGYNCSGTATGGTNTTQTSSTTAQYTCSNGTKVISASQCTSTTTSTYTCSDGTKVTDSSKCPATQTTYMSWPQSQAECTKYKGVWCPPATMGGSSTSATYSGSCMMAGQTCPKPSTANMMTCWDNTQVPLSSSCPLTPTNSNDCSVKGGQWCASTATGGAATAGWCTSKGNGCPKYPPAGKMTCPDNQTYASNLSDCPTASSTETEQDLNYKTCPDTGTLVKKGQSCPVPKKYIICKNGEKVEEGMSCQPEKKKPDEINTCMNQGGIWCADSANNSMGYCSYEGNKCALNETTTKKTGLTEKSYRQLENKKKDLLRKLDTFDKFFSKVGDHQSLEKVASLKQQIASLPQESSSFDALDIISDDLDSLRDIKDSYVNKNVDTQSEQDQMLQKKALSKLKSNIARFAGQLSIVRARIAKLEKGGMSVPETLKSMVDKAYDMVKQVQTASSFEEARNSAESLRDLADDLNETLVKIEQLTRIQSLIKPINDEISRREKDFKRVQIQAQKLKVDIDSLIWETSVLIGEVRAAFEKIKTGDFSDNEIADFIQSEIIDKLDSVDDKLANLQSLTNLKASIKNLNARITKYRKQLDSLKRKNKKLDTTEMSALLKEIISHQDGLNKLSKQKISEDNIASIVDELSIILNLSDQLEDLLLLSPQSSIERELKRKTKASETLKEIDIPTLEVSILRAARVATFIRRTPNQTAEFMTIGGPRKVNTQRGVLVNEQ